MRQSLRPGVYEAPGRLRGAPLSPAPRTPRPPARITMAFVFGRGLRPHAERPGRGQSVPPLPWAAMLRLLRLAFIRPCRDENSRNPGLQPALC